MLGEAVRKAEAWRCQAPHHFLSLVAPLDGGVAWKMKSSSCLVHWV